jgi:hypothetical protein
MPYACELAPAALAHLIAWVPGAAGGPVAVEARDGVPYGEEARYLESFGARGGDRADIVVLPFNLAATPEAENHGAVIAGGARPACRHAAGCARLLVVVDEARTPSAWPAAPERLAERREAWRSFVQAHGSSPRS